MPDAVVEHRGDGGCEIGRARTGPCFEERDRHLVGECRAIASAEHVGGGLWRVGGPLGGPRTEAAQQESGRPHETERVTVAAAAEPHHLTVVRDREAVGADADRGREAIRDEVGAEIVAEPLGVHVRRGESGDLRAGSADADRNAAAAEKCGGGETGEAGADDDDRSSGVPGVSHGEGRRLEWARGQPRWLRDGEARHGAARQTPRSGARCRRA